MDSLRVSKARKTGDMPYVLPPDEGETWAIVGSRSIMRFLATGETTDNDFAVMQTRGGPTRPVMPHWHKEAHDVFLCTKGSMQVWAGDQSRILRPGDLASLPPRTRHSFDILQPNTEFLGLVVPGNWIKFFKEIGEPYAGPLYPTTDARPFPVAQYRAAIEEKGHDVIPDPAYKLFPAQNPDPAADSKLPEDRTPYFLRADLGPRYALGAQVCSPLVTNVQSGGRFTICAIEGSNFTQASHGSALKFKFTKTDFLLRVAEGKVVLSFDNSKRDTLTSGESAFIPRNTVFSYRFPGKYGRFYLFGGKNEGGLEHIFKEAGTTVQGLLEAYAAFDYGKVAAAARQIDAEVM